MTDLPPLPDPILTHDRNGNRLLVGPCYSADQMRDYARAALAASPAPEVVAWVCDCAPGACRDGEVVGGLRAPECRRKALHPAAPAQAPGWKLVPLEPTLDMVQAGIDEAQRGGYGEHIYAAMVEAAPSAAPAAVPLTPLRRGVNGTCSRSDCVCEREGFGDQCIWLKPMTAATPQEPKA